MVKIYVRQILAGKITLQDVPERWRAETARQLAEAGYPADTSAEQSSAEGGEASV